LLRFDANIPSTFPEDNDDAISRKSNSDAALLGTSIGTAIKVEDGSSPGVKKNISTEKEKEP
jgi:hypothetical protein